MNNADRNSTHLLVLGRALLYSPIKQNGDVRLLLYRQVSPLICLSLAHGLWGHAKFQNAAAAPFAALVSHVESSQKSS